MCYLLQTEYVRVIAVHELDDPIEVAVVALIDPAVDVVRGDPQPLAHDPPSTALEKGSFSYSLHHRRVMK